MNHINPKTKDIIKGSTTGVFAEWKAHNLALIPLSIGDFVLSLFGSDALKGKPEKAMHADIGTTIFSDKHDGFTFFMGVYYLFLNPASFVFDLLVHIIRG